MIWSVSSGALESIKRISSLVSVSKIILFVSIELPKGKLFKQVLQQSSLTSDKWFKAPKSIPVLQTNTIIPDETNFNYQTLLR